MRRNPFNNQVQRYKDMSVEIPTEESEQIALVQWLRIKKIPHFHPRNEGIHKAQYMKKSKAMGVYSGVPDLILLLPSKLMAIELKRRPKITKTGKESVAHVSLSETQQEWIDTMNCYDYCLAVVAYGAEQAIEMISKELGI